MTIDAGHANTPSVFEADLPAVGYEQAPTAEAAHALIRQARQQRPIAMGAHGPEVLTYELARTVLRDDRFATPVGVTLKAQGVTSGDLWDLSAKLLPSLKGAEHHRQRRLVSQAFTPRAAARLRPTCAELINGLIDPHVVKGSCDVGTDIAPQYPVPIICALLGTPPEDWPLFSAWAEGFFKMFAWNAVNDAPEIMSAYHQLEGYLDEMVNRRREAPTEDLLSDMMRAEVDGDRLTHDELLVLSASLLVAGSDTTRNQLAAAVQTFCDHPDQWTLLAENPDLAHKAVEEVLRHSPIIFATMREALEDVELDGVTIPAGTMVMINCAGANRDPAAHHEPDRFDITREQTSPVMNFGGGIHHCLGAHLARIELAEALTTMARRMPNIRRTGEAPWRPIVGITGPESLPVAFDPGH